MDFGVMNAYVYINIYGQFGVESDGHSGSTFWFTLRRSQPTNSVDDLDLNAPYVIDYK